MSATEVDFSSQDTGRDESDILNILVATDIHLGFEEKDPVRDQDTFDTFEEILKTAAAEEVDFILLGGDLFHEASPSPYCLYKCTELLRRYCLGDRPVEIEYLSDPSRNFRTSYNPTVNYEDPNLNVSIPVFSIHGNHDDPTGQRQISAMDLLSTSGLVNYFGRWNSLDKVEVEPILLKKGRTQLALYGLSHIKDERLGRLFLDKKVKMMYPEDRDNWFHLLVWHQNRATRGVKNFIPDDCLPEFLDLVVWGHEHDCRIVPERKYNDVFVSQPGSSVATSLAAGEAIPKKIGLLKIYKNEFQMIPIELKTVRPFVFEELVLKELDQMMEDSTLNASEVTVNIVTRKVEDMIEEAKNLGRTEKVSEKPLIRLNVKARNEQQVFNTIRFGQSYVGRVANPEDMVKCNLIRQAVRGGKHKDTDNIQLGDAPLLADRVEDIVSKYFEEHDVLKCFPVSSLNESVRKYIDSHAVDALSVASDHLIDETLKYLEDNMPDKDEIEETVLNFKTLREKDSLNSVIKLLNNIDGQKKKTGDGNNSNTRNGSIDDDDVMVIDDDDEDINSKTSGSKTSLWGTTSNKASPASGSRGGRGSRGPRGGRGTQKPRGRGRAK